MTTCKKHGTPLDQNMVCAQCYTEAFPDNVAPAPDIAVEDEPTIYGDAQALLRVARKIVAANKKGNIPHTLYRELEQAADDLEPWFEDGNDFRGMGWVAANGRP